MAEAKSTLAFGRAAVSFQVHESDFLVLVSDNMSTFESMAFRLPTTSDLEEYLNKVVRVKAAYRDDENKIVCYNRPAVLPWADFKTLEDTGCLRKLWGMASQVAKRHLERLAGDDVENKGKITLAYSQELEDKGVNSGMPEATSDRERPSLYTLSKVQAAYGPNGSFQHISWEAFVSMEVESKLRRAGKLPKDRRELIMDGKTLKIDDAEAEFPEVPPVDNLMALQDTLSLRARAFHMLEVCTFEVAKLYGEKIFSYLRMTTAEGMRNPTLNEVRRADREIMSEILKWVAKGKGSVESGLGHYAKEMDTEPLGRLLQQQPEGHPDQGKEKTPGSSVKGSGSDSAGKKRTRSPDVKPKAAPETPLRPRMCIVCNKRHETPLPDPTWIQTGQESGEACREGGKGRQRR